ncbi:MAG: sigma-70 family RNA polymerase sigma factor [Bryobacteraceae bacterium]|nr:sigma-70 family RNA polymerase sigma factor [Bryobacteraceae bacterium]
MSAAAIDPFVLQQAEIRASQLVAGSGFTRDDWEDLRQDLLLDYLERLPLFDSRRGKPRGFMFGVVRNRAARLAAQRRRAACRVVADLPSRPHAVLDHDLRLDVAAAVARLPEHLRVVAELLLERTPHEVAHAIGKSRSRVYQMIGEIRAAFEQTGVKPEGLRRNGGAR